MGELADAWSAVGRTNLWGAVPDVIEMQSEGGAAGALHGALQSGALSTTFTASQGPLLMLPNMFKIAGELTPFVIHVAARTVATHALSIFGDHSDVMAARSTGFAMLCASSVQEAQDLALVAHATTLDPGAVPPLLRRVPHLPRGREDRGPRRLGPAGDGRRPARARAPREGLVPDASGPAGSAQNPDVFFQAREAASPSTRRCPTPCRPRWTGSPNARVARTTCSTTSAIRRPSARARADGIVGPPRKPWRPWSTEASAWGSSRCACSGPSSAAALCCRVA